MASKSRDISMLCKKGGELPENGKWSLSRVACEVPQIVESDIKIKKKARMRLTSKRQRFNTLYQFKSCTCQLLIPIIFTKAVEPLNILTESSEKHSNSAVSNLYCLN